MSEINDAKREEIRKQAKGILDNFAKTLAKVKLKGKSEVAGVGGFREEATTFNKGSRSPNYGDSEFRKAMFNNAPNKDENSILAEKKKW